MTDDNGQGDAALMTYTVLAVHPNGTALDVELVASSEHYAISRTRGTLMHRDRDLAWLLAAEYTVTDVRPFVSQANV